MKRLVLSIILGILFSFSPALNSLAGEELVGTFPIGNWKEEAVGSLAIAKMVGDGWLTYSVQEPSSFLYLKKSDWEKFLQSNEAINFCHKVGSFMRNELSLEDKKSDVIIKEKDSDKKHARVDIKVDKYDIYFFK